DSHSPQHVPFPSVEMTRNPLPARVSAPQVFCRFDCVLQICQKCVVEKRSDCQFVLSSAPRTEPAEMTTRARIKSLNPARNSERVCSGGFRPLISLGKTTNVPWQSRCLVEADISKEGLCHRTFIALRVQTIRRRKLLKRSKKWGLARMHSRLSRSRRKWTGPFIGRRKRPEMRQMAQWAALLSDCCSAAPYSARWALREFPDCLKPSCFSLARRWAERCLEPLPGQPDFLPRNGFRSRSNAISKRRSVKEESCSPSRSAALPSAIA